MTDWKEASEWMDRFHGDEPWETGPNFWLTIRAQIEGLEAARDAGADLDCNERRDDADFWWNVAAFRAVELGRQIERAEAAEARVRELEAWRDAVFDGPAVYDQLTEDAKRRTGPENVSDTLDAVARAAMQASREGR